MLIDIDMKNSNKFDAVMRINLTIRTINSAASFLNFPAAKAELNTESFEIKVKNKEQLSDSIRGLESLLSDLKNQLEEIE